MSLPPPKQHHPFLTGKYSVSPGLSKLPPDKAFELDTDLPHYLAHKSRVLSAAPHRYYATHNLTPEIEQAALTLLQARLTAEWPGHLAPSSTPPTLDAFARQVPDDIVIIRREGDRDYNAAIHLCSPNGWSAEEKIGKSFFDTHTPVAGIAPINAKAHHWVNLITTTTEGLQRFVWGLRTDDHLDHHPDSPSIPWNPNSPQAWARVERQIMLGLPHHHAGIFLIRTYLYNVQALPKQARQKLAEGIEGMSEDSAHYKGLSQTRPQITRWLREL